MAAVDDPLGDLTRAERIERCDGAILALPVAVPRSVVLCDLQEIATSTRPAALGCALGTVRSRLHRGRALLANAAKMAAAADSRQPHKR